MRILTLISILFPIAAGAGLLAVRPENRTLRCRYALLMVCLTSVMLLATVALSAAAALLFPKEPEEGSGA